MFTLQVHNPKSYIKENPGGKTPLYSSLLHLVFALHTEKA